MEITVFWMNRQCAEVGGLDLRVHVVAARNSVTQWDLGETSRVGQHGMLSADEAWGKLLEARFCNKAGLWEHKEKRGNDGKHKENTICSSQL